MSKRNNIVKYLHFRFAFLVSCRTKLQLAVSITIESSAHQKLSPKGRRRRNPSNLPGTALCPWKWGLDDDPHRKPRFLAKAECSGCPHFCRVVYFSHKALVQRCDSKTGFKVWRFTEKTLPIAYLYDT